MVVNYLWNNELSETLYHSLGALETVLRNSIDATLAREFGRGDWYDLPGVLTVKQPGQVSEVKDRITRDNKPILPGRVIAGLDFGFWTTLLSRGYRRLWTPSNHRLVQQTFPYAPSNMQTRPAVFDRINEARFLRNRVFHYECIADDPRLREKHANVIGVIGWISPQVQTSVQFFDRFDNVYTNGRRRIEHDLKRHLRVP